MISRAQRSRESIKVLSELAKSKPCSLTVDAHYTKFGIWRVTRLHDFFFYCAAKADTLARAFIHSLTLRAFPKK